MLESHLQSKCRENYFIARLHEGRDSIHPTIANPYQFCRFLSPCFNSPLFNGPLRHSTLTVHLDMVKV